MLALAEGARQRRCATRRRRTCSCSARRCVPGTVEDVLRPIIENASPARRDGVDFHVCFQPEFLREGSSIRTTTSRRSRSSARNADAPATQAAGLFGHLPCEFHATSVRAAEMVKYCCNNFHALKITFANETARLCEALGVDPFEVMDLVCQDTPAQHLAGLSEAGLRLRRLVPAEGPARDDASRQDARRRTADARRHPVVQPAHIDHAIAKVMAIGQPQDRHDRAVVQDRHRRSAREPAGRCWPSTSSARDCSCWSTTRRCIFRICSARTAATSSSICRTSAS